MNTLRQSASHLCLLSAWADRTESRGRATYQIFAKSSYSLEWLQMLVLRLGALPVEGERENLLPCRGLGSGDAGSDEFVSDGLDCADSFSSASSCSSPDTISLSLRIIDFLGLDSPTADLHLLETKSLNPRTFILTSRPKCPFWNDTPVTGNDRGVKLVIWLTELN